MKFCDRNLTLPAMPYYGLCTNKSAFAKILKQLGEQPTDFLISGSDGTTHHLRNQKKQRVCVVCIDEKYLKSEPLFKVVGLITHEAVHVWQEYRDRTLHESQPSSELEAYCIQRITQSLMLQVRR